MEIDSAPMGVEVVLNALQHIWFLNYKIYLTLFLI